MKIAVSKLTSDDLGAVDELMKRNSRTLGFLPREALRDYFKKGGALGVKSNNGELMGYLLYAETHKDRFRIAQLCVSEDYRGQGIAKQLIDTLKRSATTQKVKVIRLHCRRDFPAHNMWRKLGFIPLGEKPSRSSVEHVLTLWCLTLAPDSQLSLFQAKTSDETLDVVIDAHIFFDFDETESEKTIPSKSLRSDSLVDSLNIWITNELFVEINRKEDSDQRQKSQQRAHFFPCVKDDSKLTEHFESLLNEILPNKNESQKSDIQQLSKTAAADIKFFITRDRSLLRKSKEIYDSTNLQVLSPTELILQLDKLSEKQPYAPNFISGLNLKWSRLSSDDIASFPFESFLNKGERKGNFREKLESFLAVPRHFECDLLWSEDKIIAIRVLENKNKMFTAHLTRVVSCTDRSLFECFLVSDTVNKAVRKNMEAVKFVNGSYVPRLIPYLTKIGFKKCNNEDFIRFCFSRYLGHEEVLSAIAKLHPESIGSYQSMPELELEKCCSPHNLKLVSKNQKYFLIPIKPGFAISLVDWHQSADNLFGGDPNVLLLWDKVYYRSKTCSKMLATPARILWYVSKPQKQIVAVSSLDDVEVGAAKNLFKKFKKFGILKWKDIHEICKGNPSATIMVLRFSHTFPFRKTIPLHEIKTIYKEDNPKQLSLQSPLKIPSITFQKLFQFGFPGTP